MARWCLNQKTFESLLINRISVIGVLNDPTQHPDFDPDVTEYPIDSDGIEYIKRGPFI